MAKESNAVPIAKVRVRKLRAPRKKNHVVNTVSSLFCVAEWNKLRKFPPPRE